MSSHLSALEVCVARHDIVNVFLGSFSYDLQQIDKVFLNLPQLVTKPQPQIRSDLVIATPSPDSSFSRVSPVIHIISSIRVELPCNLSTNYFS